MSARRADDQGLPDEGEDTSGHDQDKGGLVAWRRLHTHHERTLRCDGRKCNDLSFGLPRCIGKVMWDGIFTIGGGLTFKKR